MRILVVEDEWLIAEDHASNVRRSGHEVVGPVASVKAAMDLLGKATIEGALLDVQLNGETSYAIADLLTEKATPFAFLTGFNEFQLPERFASVPLQQKPTSFGDVNRLLEHFSAASVA